MTWQREPFRHHYRAHIGTEKSSNSYVSYLNLIDEIVGGLDEQLAAIEPEQMVGRVERQPSERFKSGRSRSNCLSALKAYVAFSSPAGIFPVGQPRMARQDPETPARIEPVADGAIVRDLLCEAKALGARYYEATGKPLGVTGEVAELEAAERLGLRLVAARSPGHDAIAPNGRRVQIKGRAVSRADRYQGRCPSITIEGCDTVALVLLDRATMETIEIWEADIASVAARLSAPGSIARNKRGSLAISQFRSVARCVWKEPAS